MESRVKRYVESKNPAPEGARQLNASAVAGNLSDMKVEVPRTGMTSNNSQTTVNGKQYSRRVQGGQPDSLPEVNKTTGQRPFYGTDDSSIGELSETSSVKLESKHFNQDKDTNDHTYENDDENLESSEGEPGDDSNGEPSSDQDQESDGGLSPRLRQKMHKTDREIAGASLPYMKGDSYPNTTSGNPSVTDLAELRAVAHETTSKSPMQRSGRPSAFTQDANVRPQSRDQETYNRAPTKASHATQPKNEVQGPQDRQVTTGFKFGNLREVSKSVQPPASKGLPSSNVADRSTSRPTNLSSERVIHQAEGASQLTEQRMKFPVRDYQDASKTAKTSGPVIPAKQQGTSTTVRQQHFSNGDVGFSGRYVSGTVSQEHEHEHEHEQERDSLDYESAELFNLDYATLKQQSFDSDPNAEEFEFGDDQSVMTLEGKLSMAQTLGQKSQAEFFASLPIDEWEQAGEWFLSRFGNVLEKLKTNRREKREAAKVFEGEIEKRHVAVSKKRKQTEEELVGMKASGVKVLERTPKKTKTK